MNVENIQHLAILLIRWAVLGGFIAYVIVDLLGVKGITVRWKIK